MDQNLHYPASITCFQVIYFLISLRIFKGKIKPATPLIEGVLRASHWGKGLTDIHETLGGQTNFKITQPISSKADTGIQLCPLTSALASRYSLRSAIANKRAPDYLKCNNCHVYA